MRTRPLTGPKRVLEAICILAEELSTPPTQQQVAEHLDCSPQYVSAMMRELEHAGAIQWLTRYTYQVVNAEWLPPDIHSVDFE